MKIPIRIGIFATFSFVMVLSISLLAFWITNRIRPNYLKLVEENLVDTSRVMAAYMAEDMINQGLTEANLEKTFQRVYSEPFQSRIYEVSKRSVDLKVYLTDAKGKVLFHSGDPTLVGSDFSQWRNISRTLRGGYGARATRTDPNDARTLHLHVSAPILVNNHIAGVLTVAKPVTWATFFMEEAKDEIILSSIVAGFLALILSLLMSAWLLRPIGRLTEYAESVARGDRATLPRLGHAEEVQTMGLAIETMHNTLAGKHYVEHYIQSLTHEIKSPVSAIRGAAELLNDAMSAEQRNEFLANIQAESNRITRIVDQLLELSAVEKMNHLETTETLDLVGLTQQVIQTLDPTLQTYGVRVQSQFPPKAIITGDAFLLTRAISNLIQNAIEFSPEGGVIEIILKSKQNEHSLSVIDSGPGIPEFALTKVFDRFFSLPRPRSKRKSSGLGLAFAKEIMELHNANIRLENRPGEGTKVTLTFSA